MSHHLVSANADETGPRGRPVLMKKTLEFADALGVKDFNASNGESMFTKY